MKQHMLLMTARALIEPWSLFQKSTPHLQKSFIRLAIQFLILLFTTGTTFDAIAVEKTFKWKLEKKGAPAATGTIKVGSSCRRSKPYTSFEAALWQRGNTASYGESEYEYTSVQTNTTITVTHDNAEVSGDIPPVFRIFQRNSESSGQSASQPDSNTYRSSLARIFRGRTSPNCERYTCYGLQFLFCPIFLAYCLCCDEEPACPMWPDRREAQRNAIPGSLPPHVNQHSIHYQHQTSRYERVTNPENTLIVRPFGDFLGQWFNELRPSGDAQSTHQRYVFIPGITSRPVWCEISLRTYFLFERYLTTVIYINSIPDNPEHQVSPLRIIIDAEWTDNTYHSLRSLHILQGDVQLDIAHNWEQFNRGFLDFPPPLDTDNHSRSSESETPVCPACADEALQLTH